MFSGLVQLPCILLSFNNNRHREKFHCNYIFSSHTVLVQCWVCVRVVLFICWRTSYIECEFRVAKRTNNAHRCIAFYFIQNRFHIYVYKVDFHSMLYFVVVVVIVVVIFALFCYVFFNFFFISLHTFFCLTCPGCYILHILFRLILVVGVSLSLL